MKKIFGELDLTYKKIIISSFIIGILVGLLNSVSFLKDTTITDIATNYEFWVLCGILIIVNSKSCKDSALKCFLFFLISQPLIYLVESPFSSEGLGLFRYYPFWGKMTLLCLPMGFIGYYLKKDKWYSLLILIPMLLLTSMSISSTLHGVMYSFPHHLINLIFIIFVLIAYPLSIFNNKKIKYIGLAVSILLIMLSLIYSFKNNNGYETIINCNSEEMTYNEEYKVYLEDNNLGEVRIEYYSEFEDYCIFGKFIKSGNTKLILEDKAGNKKEYKLDIGKGTYNLNV